jgi:hypothetical protein
MSEHKIPPVPTSTSRTPSEEFASYCEAEFERRLNSGDDFEQGRYQKAMALVMDRLQDLEREGKA